MAGLIENENRVRVDLVTNARWITIIDRYGHAKTIWGVLPKPKSKFEIVDGEDTNGEFVKLTVFRRDGREIKEVVVLDENGQPLTGLPMSRNR